MDRYKESPSGFRKAAPWIAVALALALVAGMAWWVFTARLDPEVAGAGANADQAQESIPEDWPVQPTRDPDRLVRGDGKFLDPEAVDTTDPDAVAEAAARLAVSWDAGVDGTEGAGIRYAEPLLDPALVLPEPPSRPGVEGWAQAAREQAFTTARATPVDLHSGHAEDAAELVPSDTTGELVKPYQFRVVYGWQGRVAGPDGGNWVHPSAGARTVYVGLVERDGEWKVLDYGQDHLPLQ